MLLTTTSNPAPNPPTKPTPEPAGENPTRVLKNPVPEAGIRVSDEEVIGVSEEGRMDLDLDSEPVIPGLSTDGALVPGLFSASAGQVVKQVDDLVDEGNWGSDESEDDLQIVLNDTHVPTRVGVEDDDDEDGEDLVIVADGDRHHPGGEELELGEELPQGVVEGERKEAGEAARGW